MFNCFCVVYANTWASGVPLAAIVDDITAGVHCLAPGPQEIGTKLTGTARTSVGLEKTLLGPRSSE